MLRPSDLYLAGEGVMAFERADTGALIILLFLNWSPQ